MEHFFTVMEERWEGKNHSVITWKKCLFKKQKQMFLYFGIKKINISCKTSKSFFDNTGIHNNIFNLVVLGGRGKASFCLLFFKEKKKKWKFGIIGKKATFAKKLKGINCIFKNKGTEVKFQRYNLGNKYELQEMQLLLFQERRYWSSSNGEKRVGSFSSLCIRQDKEFKQPIFILRFIIHAHTQTCTTASKETWREMRCPTTAAFLLIPTPASAPAAANQAMA